MSNSVYSYSHFLYSILLQKSKWILSVTLKYIYTLKKNMYYITSGFRIQSKCPTMSSNSPVRYSLWLLLCPSTSFSLSHSSLPFMLFLNISGLFPPQGLFYLLLLLPGSVFLQICAQAAPRHSGLRRSHFQRPPLNDFYKINSSPYLIYTCPPINHSTLYAKVFSPQYYHQL